MLVVLLAFAPCPARASDAVTAPLPTCEAESTALARIACQVVGLLLADRAASSDVVATEATAASFDDGRVVLPKSVRERLAQLVARRLGGAARANPETAELPRALERTSAACGLVYLGLALYRDRLQVSVDQYLGAGRFWQRVRAPGLRLARHIFTSVPVDAELRAFLPAVPLVVTQVDKARVNERDIVGLACGDVRGDGSTELVTISRRRVQTGHVVHGIFTARATLTWADFSRIAHSPLREPIATGSVPTSGTLRVGLSDRADALEISGRAPDALRVERLFHDVLPWPGGGCTRRASLAYEGMARACIGTSREPEVDFAMPVDAFATLGLTSNEQTRTVRVARPLGRDDARVLDSLHPEVRVPGVGAQLAVADLDDDGLPEIASSLPTLDRTQDQLVVRTLLDNGQLRERFRLSVPSGIDALAVCPGVGPSMAKIALATGDGLWIVR